MINLFQMSVNELVNDKTDFLLVKSREKILTMIRWESFNNRISFKFPRMDVPYWKSECNHDQKYLETLFAYHDRGDNADGKGTWSS